MFLTPLFRKINQWYFEPRSQWSMVVARVTFGLSLFFAYIYRFKYIPQFLGPSGFGGQNFLSRHLEIDSFSRTIYKHFEWLSLTSSMSTVWALYFLLLLSALLFAIGYRTRFFGLLLFFLHSLFLSRSVFMFWGWADMVRPFLLYVCFSRAGDFYSLSEWIAKGRLTFSLSAKKMMGPGWPIRLMQINVATMYSITGLERLSREGWLSGDMVYFAFNSNMYSRLPMVDWLNFMPLLIVGNFYTFAIEALAPFLLWFRKLRPWVIFGLIELHIGLELLANVGFWNLIMIAGVLTFADGDEFFFKIFKKKKKNISLRNTHKLNQV